MSLMLRALLVACVASMHDRHAHTRLAEARKAASGGDSTSTRALPAAQPPLPRFAPLAQRPGPSLPPLVAAQHSASSMQPSLRRPRFGAPRPLPLPAARPFSWYPTHWWHRVVAAPFYPPWLYFFAMLLWISHYRAKSGVSTVNLPVSDIAWLFLAFALSVYISAGGCFGGS